MLAKIRTVNPASSCLQLPFLRRFELVQTYAALLTWISSKEYGY